MTVSDLIKELNELPPDLPVVSSYKEITEVCTEDNFYYLTNWCSTKYASGPVVVLE